jgi:hypothetical protein
MKIAIETKQTAYKDVKTPSFWKDKYSNIYLGIFNEDQCIKLLLLPDDITSVRVGKANNFYDDLGKIEGTSNEISEEEFMQIYSDTLKSISLEPELVR